MMNLMAQTAPPDAIASVLTSVISSLGVLGVLVWIVYHILTRTVPDLTTQYTESIERTSAKFAKTLEDEREYRKQEIRLLQGWIQKEASCRYNDENYPQRKTPSP